ncbi:unnamed protein product [Amoebophrya sp. A120]|nr:unnamed protein product [Amoebophrya sp. A120]|eukprot:GSA120T00023528001.1
MLSRRRGPYSDLPARRCITVCAVLMLHASCGGCRRVFFNSILPAAIDPEESVLGHRPADFVRHRRESMLFLPENFQQEEDLAVEVRSREEEAPVIQARPPFPVANTQQVEQERQPKNPAVSCYLPTQEQLPGGGGDPLRDNDLVLPGFLATSHASLSARGGGEDDDRDRQRPTFIAIAAPFVPETVASSSGEGCTPASISRGAPFEAGGHHDVAPESPVVVCRESQSDLPSGDVSARGSGSFPSESTAAPADTTVEEAVLTERQDVERPLEIVAAVRPPEVVAGPLPEQNRNNAPEQQHRADREEDRIYLPPGEPLGKLPRSRKQSKSSSGVGNEIKLFWDGGLSWDGFSSSSEDEDEDDERDGRSHPGVESEDGSCLHRHAKGTRRSRAATYLVGRKPKFFLLKFTSAASAEPIETPREYVSTMELKDIRDDMQFYYLRTVDFLQPNGRMEKISFDNRPCITAGDLDFSCGPSGGGGAAANKQVDKSSCVDDYYQEERKTFQSSTAGSTTGSSCSTSNDNRPSFVVDEETETPTTAKRSLQTRTLLLVFGTGRSTVKEFLHFWQGIFGKLEQEHTDKSTYGAVTLAARFPRSLRLGLPSGFVRNSFGTRVRDQDAAVNLLTSSSWSSMPSTLKHHAQARSAPCSSTGSPSSSSCSKNARLLRPYFIDREQGLAEQREQIEKHIWPALLQEANGVLKEFLHLPVFGSEEHERPRVAMKFLEQLIYLIESNSAWSMFELPVERPKQKFPLRRREHQVPPFNIHPGAAAVEQLSPEAKKVANDHAALLEKQFAAKWDLSLEKRTMLRMLEVHDKNSLFPVFMFWFANPEKESVEWVEIQIEFSEESSTFLLRFSDLEGANSHDAGIRFVEARRNHASGWSRRQLQRSCDARRSKLSMSEVLVMEPEPW